MRKRQVILMCCLLTVTSIQGTYADTEDKSEDEANPPSDHHGDDIPRLGHVGNSSAGVETAVGGNVSSVEVGPPDSHEAMNYRETLTGDEADVADQGDRHETKTTTGTREKRSYEFLMGLVHNNSKYELTKIDPSSRREGDYPLEGGETHQPSQDPGEGKSAGIIEGAVRKRGGGEEASELLLELVVKIAAHPDRWDKVHRLLQKIEGDLASSKRLVDDLQKAKVEFEPKQEKAIAIEKKEPALPTRQNKTSQGVWPDLHGDGDDYDDDAIVSSTDSNRWRPQQQMTAQHKSTRPKTFAYHRVTGRPLYLSNKNPKAYIAVSVIAPKPMAKKMEDSREIEGDLDLEKELRQLKPWTHSRNLDNMADLRKTWVVDKDGN